MSKPSLAGINSWHSCSDNSVIVRVCVMLSMHRRLTNPSVGSVDIYWGYHTATSQRNHPYEYRPLIFQRTDSLLYSKIYSANSRYLYSSLIGAR